MDGRGHTEFIKEYLFDPSAINIKYNRNYLDPKDPQFNMIYPETFETTYQRYLSFILKMQDKEFPKPVVAKKPATPGKP